MSLDPSIKQSEYEPDAGTALQTLLVVSPDGRIQFATARADLWMTDFFAVTSPLKCLPEALIRWLCHGTSGGRPPSFIADQPGRRLCIQLVCREPNLISLLLERSAGISATVGSRSLLTNRQTEVLAWVARGKTNAEIGKILSLKTGTVGKYLERVFSKLGVENRTAAASFVLRAKGAN